MRKSIVQKTYSQKQSEVSRTWYVVDASQAPLGRVATQVATLLSGKHKPTFTPHIDGGDTVIIINAAQTVVTGAKADDKMYYRHSQYPGGLTETTFKDQLIKDPRKILEKAIYGMLPPNKLRPERMKRLKIYPDANHNHAAQQPVNYSLTKEK